MDYLYLDGAAFGDEAGISAARNAKIRAAKMAWLHDLQVTFDLLPGGGRNIFLNGVDAADTAAKFNPTGAAGVMLDHWRYWRTTISAVLSVCKTVYTLTARFCNGAFRPPSFLSATSLPSLSSVSILQYLQRGPQVGCGGQKLPPQNLTCGQFDPTAMDGAFTLARSKVLSNMTLQVKGWVGPVIKQEGHYPPQMHTPTAGAERQQAAIGRFNSELALFLLVAEDRMYWMYSWFWGFDSWVPGQSDSQGPPTGGYPQARCQLGAPAGPPSRKAGTWTYTREYEHASVFVDLNNRTACRVDFTGSC
jgi:hypothetical protein